MTDDDMRDLGAAWLLVDAAVRERMPGGGFGVAADGPGYHAWAGNEEWHGGYVDAWSVADPELTDDPDLIASPTRALTRLAVKIAEKR